MLRLAQSTRNLLLAALRRPSLHGRNFIGAWIRSPFAMGAVMPSSRMLARAMAAQIDLGAPGIVIELGAGTGAVTQALVQTGISPDKLIIVERDTRLHKFLTQNFPQLHIICADAAMLDKAISERGIKDVNAIVSSLPLLSMPRALQTVIEARMAEAIGDTGKIIQFTYGPKSPVSQHTLRKYGLFGQRVRTVLANIPPAQVWVYKKG